MASRTQTETKREITKKGDIIIVKETETTTIFAPGKEPEVKEITRVEEFKGEEGFKRLPEEIRRQLEQPSKTVEKAWGTVSKNATKGDFVKEILAEHNRYRKAHGVDALKLSQELLKVSQERAEELAAKDEMSARQDHRYGENVSCLWSSDPDHTVTAVEIVSRWYSEGKDYKFDEEPKNLNSGHFTQMIWKACTDLGAAAAKSNTNKIYVVATYSPPGNFVEEFRNNVFPPGGKSSSRKDSLIKGGQKAGAGPSASTSNLNDEGVKIHNEYRAKHGVPPLIFSIELATYAQEWANYLAEKDKFQHRNSGKFGENLYCFQSSDPNAVATAADACKSWYEEIKMHSFNAEPKTLKSGHFSQMIWKGTKEVGMGRAKSKKGLQILVANYNPAGNLVGAYKDNVPPPLK